MIHFPELMLHVLATLWFLPPFALLMVFVKSPLFKGWIGEAIVNWSVRYHLDRRTYRLIKNVTLPVDGGTTQIDHIIVSRFGVFVLETKNLKGWIFGGEHHKTWTQKIYRRSWTFQNPLHQNLKHVKALETLLAGLGNVAIHSVIVFVGDCTFKTSMPDNVTRVGGHIRYIRSQTRPVLEDWQVADIVARIRARRRPPSLKTHRDHVAHVKRIVAGKATGNTCPECGSTLACQAAQPGADTEKQIMTCTNFAGCRNAGATLATTKKGRTTNERSAIRR